MANVSFMSESKSMTEIVNDVASTTVPMETSCIYNLCMDTTEVTRSAYALNNGLPPPTDPLLPVTNVNYYKANAYCEKMGKHLPSGAEWRLFAGPFDYATADGKMKDSNGNKEANYNSNGPMNVCSFPANSHKMCDMSGNVAEWVTDSGGTLNNGEIARQVLGGSWDGTRDASVYLLVSSSFFVNADAVSDKIGFRCVMGGVLGTQRRLALAKDIVKLGNDIVASISSVHTPVPPVKMSEEERSKHLEERESVKVTSSMSWFDAPHPSYHSEPESYEKRKRCVYRGLIEFFFHDESKGCPAVPYEPPRRRPHPCKSNSWIEECYD